MKKKVTEFPFASACRIRMKEVEAAQTAIKGQFGLEAPQRRRPAKELGESYELVSIRLHPKILAWAKEEAARQGIGYQTVINEALLKIAP